MKFVTIVAMPFLKCIKTSYTERKIENSKRNGLRHAIFSPQTKELFKGYYIGEWENNVKKGRGKEVDRYFNYYIKVTAARIFE